MGRPRWVERLAHGMFGCDPAPVPMFAGRSEVWMCVHCGQVFVPSADGSRLVEAEPRTRGSNK